MSDEIKAGDVVRVKNPSAFISELARKVTNRVAIVQWVGPDEHGQFAGRARITFQKRNGRGKEFSETMRKSDLVLASSPKEGPGQ